MIDIPIYGGKLQLILSPESFEETVSEVDPDCSLHDHRGLVQVEFDENHSPTYFVGVFDGKLNTLVHEVSHAALMIVERSGFSPLDGNGEPYCYLVDYLFNILAEEIG